MNREKGGVLRTQVILVFFVATLRIRLGWCLSHVKGHSSHFCVALMGVTLVRRYERSVAGRKVDPGQQGWRKVASTFHRVSKKNVCRLKRMCVD